MARDLGADAAVAGISVYLVNSDTGELELVQQVGSDNPFFFAFHPSGAFIYAVNLTNDFEGEKSGSVEAYAVDPDSGTLTFLNRQATAGSDPCHLAVDPGGRFLTVANYGGASWSVLPIAEDGSLLPVTHEETRAGSGPNAARQDAPHPHAITYHPTGKFLIGADLGTDKVIVFRLDTGSGALKPVWEARLAPGAGPRHVAFNAEGNRLYVLNELNATITLFDFDVDSGAIGNEIQTILTVQPEAVGPMTTAEILLHPSGKFLFNTNRGQPISLTPESDSIVSFQIEEATGRLTLVGHMMEEVGVPWNIAFNAAGTKLYAPNFKNDSITIYDVDQNSGALTYTGIKYDSRKPFCIIMSH
jgi:6-phosphogluconolactonase (cycloisomerase 2 family)